MAVSVRAALSGGAGADLAVGNVVGSNIFNVLAVLGVSGLVAPDGLRVAGGILAFDLPVMLAIACLPIFFSGHRIARWESAVFLAYYVAYTAYVVLAATEHDALARFSAAMLEFVLPMTGLTLLVVGARAWRSGGAASQGI